eukprot:13438361-Ditylum_brightwellii.AAC.1
MTCPMLVPYLKGVHLTLELWRKKQDIYGWKYSDKEWLALRIHINIDQADKSSNGPETVHATPRLVSDLEALSELTNYENLPV